MVREISAGGVVIRQSEGEWSVAVIELPAQPFPPSPAAPAKTRPKANPVLALPKGLVDPGEKPLQTALREVLEETGLTAELITKLADIKYIYTRTWAGGERVFKIVSFYLMRYISGQIDDIKSEMRIEVAKARWMELGSAAKLLSYKGEKQVARKAWEYLCQHPEI